MVFVFINIGPDECLAQRVPDGTYGFVDTSHIVPTPQPEYEI